MAVSTRLGRAAALACGLLCLFLTPTADARPLPVPGAFKLEGSNGYSVLVWALPARHGGQGSALVYVSGRSGSVNYFAPATVTRTAIRARLGDLGEIDVDFNPSGHPQSERSVCGGRPVVFDSGSYEGTIDFIGEQGYTEAHATEATGDIQFALDVRQTAGRATSRSTFRGARR